SAPADDEEAGFLVGRLIGDDDAQRARSVWAALLPGQAAPQTAGLYDGDFAPRPGAAPFNWRLAAGGEAVAERAQPPRPLPSGGAPAALHVQFTPTTPARLAEQMLLLPPGRYRLTGAVMFDTPV